MTISKKMENKKITFTLDGMLDTITVPQLQEILIPAFDEANHVELDFSKVTYISSAGLRVLLTGHKTSVSKEASMTLSGVSQGIMEIIKMTGFDKILKIV